jgi:hypothetical protein
VDDGADQVVSGPVTAAGTITITVGEWDEESVAGTVSAAGEVDGVAVVAEVVSAAGVGNGIDSGVTGMMIIIAVDVPTISVSSSKLCVGLAQLESRFVE